MVKQKKWTFLICSKAVGNAHNNDKSRPYILWTLADLFVLLLIELPTFWSNSINRKRENQYVLPFNVGKRRGLYYAFKICLLSTFSSTVICWIAIWLSF